MIERLESDVENLKNRLQAIIIAKETAKLDFDRQQELNKQGLSSTKKLEKAKIEYKNYISKEADIRNKLNTAESKLSSQKTQVIYAPSDGVIVQTISGDEATIITKGQKLANFIPDNIKYAVELFVDGMDIPLIYPGRKVRLQFEGWPAIQFSGWPSTAIGTFGGVVEVVDPSVSPNGKFRVIIVEDPDDHPWPDNKYLRYGARAKGWVLLETVSVGYELWRQLNNFPPEITRSQVQADKNQNKITNDE